MSARPGHGEAARAAQPSDATVAGMLLAARTLLARLGLPHPTVTEILDATGSRSTLAYARRAQVWQLLSTLERAPGRPRAEAAALTETEAITREVAEFLIQHPGAAHGAPRRRYSHAFRQLVLDLRARYPSVPDVAFARAVHVPLTTLRMWRNRRPDEAGTAAPARLHDIPVDRSGPAAMVTSAWRTWHGSFSRFCEYVQRELGIPWKRTYLGHVLSSRGLRQQRPRPGRQPATQATHQAFSTFFPGAQWMADGTSLSVRVNGRDHRFNLELVVDPASGAIVGASVRDREDGQAVVEAFEDAVATTQAAPLMLLLDHHPCNQTDLVGQHIQPTTRIYAARGRPQSKAHVEGAFGLLAQTAPELDIVADSPRALAQAVLRLLVQCWARTLNHRPRRDRHGRSRAQLHRDDRATPLERAAARAELRDRAARHRARCGRRARQPVLHEFLAAELARMGVADPNGHITKTLLRYPTDAILAGIATYAGKLASGRLPSAADARYLLGIVRRIVETDEGARIADCLWQTRVTACAQVRAALSARRSAIVQRAATAEDEVASLVDEALTADDPDEQWYWLAAAACRIRTAPARARALYLLAARRIHASFALPYARRLALVRILATESVSVA